MADGQKPIKDDWQSGDEISHEWTQGVSERVRDLPLTASGDAIMSRSVTGGSHLHVGPRNRAADRLVLVRPTTNPADTSGAVLTHTTTTGGFYYGQMVQGGRAYDDIDKQVGYIGGMFTAGTSVADCIIANMNEAFVEDSQHLNQKNLAIPTYFFGWLAGYTADDDTPPNMPIVYVNAAMGWPCIVVLRTKSTDYPHTYNGRIMSGMRRQATDLYNPVHASGMSAATGDDSLILNLWENRYPGRTYPGGAVAAEDFGLDPETQVIYAKGIRVGVSEQTPSSATKHVVYIDIPGRAEAITAMPSSPTNAQIKTAFDALVLTLQNGGFLK